VDVCSGAGQVFGGVAEELAWEGYLGEGHSDGELCRVACCACGKWLN
jgi:hypothetical protein